MVDDTQKKSENQKESYNRRAKKISENLFNMRKRCRQKNQIQNCEINKKKGLKINKFKCRYLCIEQNEKMREEERERERYEERLERERERERGREKKREREREGYLQFALFSEGERGITDKVR